MKVSFLRLSGSLNSQGFQPTFWDGDTFDIRFSRKVQAGDIYEHVWVSGLGKAGECVAARFGMAVVAGGQLVVKGLGATEHVFELDDDPVHGFSEIRSSQDAIQWEKRLAVEVMRSITRYANVFASPICEQTIDARDAVVRYLNLTDLERFASIPDLHRRLHADATAHQRLEAKAIAEWVGVARIECGSLVYETAASILLTYGEQVEKRTAPFLNANPLMDVAMFWRLQLIVDRIVGTFDKWPEYFIPGNGQGKPYLGDL